MRKPDLLVVARFAERDIEALRRAYTVHIPMDATDPEACIAAAAPSVRAIATTGAVGVDGPLMARLPQLEIVACFGVGLDAIDLAQARERGICVTYTPDVLSGDVADMALALMLATLRRIPFGDRWVRDGKWPGGAMPLTTSPAGKRLGILGLGRIGHAVARRAAAFDMEILYSGRTRQADTAYGWREDALALARDSDVLMLCAAGGAGTKAIVNAAVLEALGPRGYLINIARGSLVDEPALIAALRSGSIAGAGLDVFDDEPTIDPAFAGFENVVLQPHNGSGTHEARAAMGDLMCANLAAHFAGEPLPTPVDLEIL